MMASACVNNPIGVVPTSAADHAFGWLSPRISSSSFSGNSEPSPNRELDADLPPGQDPDFIDFEFRLHDPVAMLPADELFSGGKLVPLHLPKPAPSPEPEPPGAPLPPQPAQMKQSRREELIVSGFDIFAVSPKAPTCTSRWRELLRLRKQQQQQQSVTTKKPEPVSRNPNIRSSAVKQFLHRRSSLGADPDSKPNLPSLLESEPEPFSRLSSTSSEEIFSRLSLDSDLKPKQSPILLNRNPSTARIPSSSSRPSSAAGARIGRTPARRSADAPTPRCASVDSPRMNASGKVVFHGLGRSSSSPSTFNGGGPVRHKYRGMEYSNNVLRVTNVPVPSKAGLVFGFLGSSGSKNVSSNAALRGKN